MTKKNVDPQLMRFVEEFGQSVAGSETPPMLGRVLGWLVICAPQPQSAEDIMAALKASRGAVSMATRTLLAIGLIARRSFAGDRRAYYEVRADVIARALASRFAELKKQRIAIEHGIKLLAKAPPERRETLEYLHAMYSFFEDEFTRVFTAWEKRSADLRRNKPHL
jgi:DNA-binding transcriptional regulator GbsR (MarR family)